MSYEAARSVCKRNCFLEKVIAKLFNRENSV